VGELAVSSYRDVILYALVIILLLIVAARTVRLIRSNERAVIFRLGKFVSVQSGPVILVVPYIDQVVRIKVQQIEGSERMSEEELLNRIAKIYES
jgi:regulator of protease activity HflC (stomatin/prohibitin superfamily)